MEKDIKLYKGDIAVDDRGSLSFVNDFNFEGVKRFYQVENHRAGFIRAWHGHIKEGKYVYVTEGSILIAVLPITIEGDKAVCDETKIKSFTLSAKKPSILWIPAGYANGFKTLTPNTKVIFFSTSTLEESNGDDYRFESNKFGNNIWEENFR
jgi:dTDP-4-dehydrorhamnose 3,5-epimerase